MGQLKYFNWNTKPGTHDPVKAHSIYGHSISKRHTKPDYKWPGDVLVQQVFFILTSE